MLNPELVLVHAGGETFGGWESAQVTASIKEASRTFKLETTERPGQFKFPPGTPISITANGDLLCDGYVNEYEPSGDAESHKICITGRSGSQDVVDCAADTDSGEWDNADPEQVFQDLAKPYGVQVQAKVALQKVPRWSIAPGETVHQNISRLIRPQGVSTMGNADGSIDLTNAQAAQYHYGMLAEGWNIKKYSGLLSDQGRFKNYKVRGQRRLGSTANDLHIEESDTDQGGNRARTKIVINETDTDPKRARARASHEKERAAGNAVSCSITTQGFRDFGGKLFCPNHIIYVHAPVLLHITQSMLIESLVFKQDAKKGSDCEIRLVDPRAHKGQAGGGEKSPEGKDLGGDTDPAWKKGF